MHQNRAHQDNFYRLVIGDGGPDDAQVVEFEGRGPEAALMWSARHCIGREVEVFENGRSLGVLTSVADGGFWVIRSPRAAAGHGERGAAQYAPRALTIGVVGDCHRG